MSDTWQNRETQQKDAQNGYMFTYTDDFLKLFLFLIGQHKKKRLIQCQDVVTDKQQTRSLWNDYFLKNETSKKNLLF